MDHNIESIELDDPSEGEELEEDGIHVTPIRAKRNRTRSNMDPIFFQLFSFTWVIKFNGLNVVIHNKSLHEFFKLYSCYNIFKIKNILIININLLFYKKNTLSKTVKKKSLSTSIFFIQQRISLPLFQTPKSQTK